MYDEFPHTATLKELVSVQNVGSIGTTKKWLPLEENSELECFVDTPTTDRIVEASKLGITIHRDLYCEYGIEISPEWRIEYEGQDYAIAGDIEDQSGMHEIVRIPLKRVT